MTAEFNAYLTAGHGAGRLLASDWLFIFSEKQSRSL